MLRVKLHLKINQTPAVLPASYQYELASAIHKIISSSPLYSSEYYSKVAYADYFCISKILMKFELQGDRISILSPEASMEVRFVTESAFQNFYECFFNKEILIGDRISRVSFIVNGVEKFNPPPFNSSMKFKTLSPVCVTFKNERRNDDYLHPEDEIYPDQFIDHLYQKHLALTGKRLPVNNYYFKVLSNPKTKLITVKKGTSAELKIKGYEFEFELTTHPELIKTGFFAGFGRMNSLGFGLCKTL